MTTTTTIEAPTTLDELLEQLLDGTIDPQDMYTDLPTFGGTEPHNTNDVWSWDATRLLSPGTNLGEASWVIYDRDDVGSADAEVEEAEEADATDELDDFWLVGDADGELMNFEPNLNRLRSLGFEFTEMMDNSVIVSFPPDERGLSESRRFPSAQAVANRLLEAQD